jgi:geranylgeranyl diphosphate synthase type I
MKKFLADDCLADYRLLVTLKTGALLGAAAALGALSGGASEAEADRFAAFGEAVGIAFQMQDDLLGLWGDPAATGKPAGNDLLRRKRSLPVLLALENVSLRPAVAAWLSTETPPDAAAALELIERMARAGIRAEVTRMAREQVVAALAGLADLPLAEAPLAELRLLAERAVERAR